MTTPGLTPPLVIAFIGAGATNMCLEAAYEGPDALITLQPIEWNPPPGTRKLQLWQFGDDSRIYLYSQGGPAELCMDFPHPARNGQPLQLSDGITLNVTQEWDWNTKPSTISNRGALGFFIDNMCGETMPGNRIQIWASGGNANEDWTTLIMPTHYLNSHSLSARNAKSILARAATVGH
jgi:hypothetical protein